MEQGKTIFDYILRAGALVDYGCDGRGKRRVVALFRSKEDAEAAKASDKNGDYFNVETCKAICIGDYILPIQGEPQAVGLPPKDSDALKHKKRKEALSKLSAEERAILGL